MENTTENLDSSLGDSHKKAKFLKEGIKSLEKELKTIQENCKHQNYKVMNRPTDIITFALRKVCTKCDKEIGYPSQDETDNWANT